MLSIFSVSGTKLLNPWLVHNEVCAIANSGEIFAQYLVANAYYYGDVIELMNVDMSQFTDEQATAQIRAWTETAAAMYDELIAKGIPEEKIRSYGFAFQGKKVLIG